MGTSPGHVDRPNEDFVGAVPGAVVLVDGAGIPGVEDVCHHGVAWYAHSLGTALLMSMTRDRTSPVEAPAHSIEHVAERHRHTCDLANPSSPQGTVATIRFEDDHADYLVLADAFVVLDLVGAAPPAVTDAREIAVRTACSSCLRGVPAGTTAYERAKLSAVDALRARQNQPGGYWIAKDDPHAAAEAVTASVPLDCLCGAALLSNGASRIVNPYRLAGGQQPSRCCTQAAPTPSSDTSAEQRRNREALTLSLASSRRTMHRWPTATCRVERPGARISPSVVPGRWSSQWAFVALLSSALGDRDGGGPVAAGSDRESWRGTGRDPAPIFSDKPAPVRFRGRRMREN